MEFNLPTTKSEMYVILNDIYYHYRVRRGGYEDVGLENLVLERMEYTEKNQTILMNMALTMLSDQQTREREESTISSNAKIASYQKEIEEIEKSYLTQVKEIENMYAESLKLVENKMIKSNIINSNYLSDKTAQLENEKNLKLSDLLSAKDYKVANLSAKIVEEQSRAESMDEMFNKVFVDQIEKKTLELKLEQEELEREIFKYNNGIEEKEQRGRNAKKQTDASLRLRFLDIRMGEFTKDELVEMGYYDDVIRCVMGYYDTLTPTQAFQDIKSERKLPIYLDDYYPNIVYLYNTLANNSVE